MTEAFILRNKRIFQRLRDSAFGDAEEVLEDTINNLERYKNADPLLEVFSRQMEKLVDHLENARYYARMSVGGDNSRPPKAIHDDERVYVDLIEMSYSYARSIRRITRHETVILQHIAERDNINPSIIDYLVEIRKADEDLISKNLQNLQQRLKLYRKYANKMKTNEV